MTGFIRANLCNLWTVSSFLGQLIVKCFVQNIRILMTEATLAPAFEFTPFGRLHPFEAFEQLFPEQELTESNLGQNNFSIFHHGSEFYDCLKITFFFVIKYVLKHPLTIFNDFQ